MITKIVEDRDKLICCCISSQAKNFLSVYIPKGCELGFSLLGLCCFRHPLQDIRSNSQPWSIVGILCRYFHCSIQM